MISAWEYIRGHQNALFIALLAVIVVIGGSLWMSGMRSRSKVEAQTQFAEALAAYRGGDLRTAEEMFWIITERYRRSEEGAYAYYMAGKCALEDERNIHAIERFELYLDRAGAYPFFRDAALEGIAVAWVGERDYRKAADIYLKLSDDMKTNSFMQAAYLRKAADVLKLGRQRDRAIEILQRLHEISSGIDKRDIGIEIDVLRG